MNSLRVLTYRLYFAIQDSGVGAALRRWRFASQRLDRVRLLIKRQIAPDRQVWVCAQSGLSRGLWMRLRFPEEARFWRVEHEPEVQNAIAAVVRPGDVVYDIGAFVGTVSLGVTRLVGQSGRVVAFDGDPENVRACERAGYEISLTRTFWWFTQLSGPTPPGMEFRFAEAD